MRQVVEKYTVYTFDELDKEAQERAIEDYREGMDYPWLSDDLANDLDELLDKHKISYEVTPNLYYSLSYCQGDGAMFEGVVKWGKWEAEIKHSGHYYHENSKTITLTSRNSGLEADDKTYDKFNELYVSICQEIERRGYSYIEEATSDEYIGRYLAEMDWEFHKDGRAL